MRKTLRGLQLKGVVALMPQVIGREDHAPVGKRHKGGIVWLRAWVDLIEVYGNGQTVDARPDIADSNRGVGVEFPLHCYVPLGGLRVAIAWIGRLLQLTAA